MGNETFYCIECGIRVSGVNFRGDRSRCPACLGLPVEPVPRPGRDSTMRIRKPASGIVTAVAALPRTTEIVRPRPSRAVAVGAFILVGALLFALTTVPCPSRNGHAPTTAVVVVAPPSEKTDSSFSQPPASQGVEKTTSLFSQEELPPILEELRDRVQRPAAPQPVDSEIETLADQRYGEIEEAASALADEGRFDDALARICSFPAEYRKTRAWTSLEGLKRQIEARARTK